MAKEKTLLELIDDYTWFDKVEKAKEIFRRLLNQSPNGIRQDIDLGNIGSTDIVTAFNAQDNIEVQQQKEGLRIVRAIMDSEEREFLFTGLGGTYGEDGDLEAIDDDFSEFGSALGGGGSTPGLQEVLDEDPIAIIDYNVKIESEYKLNEELSSEYSEEDYIENIYVEEKTIFDITDLSTILTSIEKTTNYIEEEEEVTNNTEITNTSTLSIKNKGFLQEPVLKFNVETTTKDLILDTEINSYKGLEINGDRILKRFGSDGSGDSVFFIDIPSLNFTIPGSINSVQANSLGELNIFSDNIPYDNTDSGLTATNVKGAIDEISSVASLGDLTSLLPIETEDTGDEISLSTSGGNLCNFGSANSNTSYTTTGTVLNAYAKVLINTTSRPTVDGIIDPIAGSTWVTGTDMYMIVNYTGSARGVEYYFLEI